MKIVDVKTSERCISLDEETATFLTESNKVKEFQKEQFDKHQVMIDQELTDPRNIWIVCEKSKIYNAEQELGGLADEKKIASCEFKTKDPLELRFLREHCWDKIKEKEKSCKAEGVVVRDINYDSLKVKGTRAGRNEMMNFLKGLAKKIDFKVCLVFFPTVESDFRKWSKYGISAQLKCASSHLASELLQQADIRIRSHGL